jgi:uncharacterized membrane protein HdeD (DUF308 family)
MNELQGQSWWVLVLRGVLALVFGVLVLAWPAMTLVLLVAMFSAYALLGGAVSVAGALKARHTDRKWWQLLLLGIVSLAAGVAALIFPVLTMLVLVLVMGANALFTGALDIAIAIRLRKVMKGQWLLALTGLLSIAFGVIVFAFPGAGALVMVWLISFYSVLSGVLLLWLGVSTRRAARLDMPASTASDDKKLHRATPIANH